MYLRPNVLAEPLVNGWYAWSSLVAPATSAMYVANAHCKMMQSFIAAPQLHAAALRNPSMVGGPFIDHAADKVPAVKALLEKTLQERAAALELAQAIKNLNELLEQEASGLSLELLYPKVPEVLKGFVELTYDLRQQPSMRFVEALLYRSRFYDEGAQSICVSLSEREDRPFAFSTPRLPGEQALHLRLPFHSRALDALFRMETEPGPLELIREALGVRPEDDESFSHLFTDEPPPRRPKFEGDGLRIRYFGHACVLVETAETSVLCDPVVSHHPQAATPRFTYGDLPETIDYLLITHSHQAHCVVETLLRLRHRVKKVLVPKNNGGSLADPSLKLMLQNIGFNEVREIEELEACAVPGGEIMGLPYFGGHADLNVRAKSAYAVRLLGKTVVFASNSGSPEPKLYERLHDVLGEVEVIFAGMECDGPPLSWRYGPLLPKPIARQADQSRRISGADYEKAISVVDHLKPKHVYVYALGQEPWLSHLNPVRYLDESPPLVASGKLLRECAGRGLNAERLFGRKEIYLGPN